MKLRQMFMASTAMLMLTTPYLPVQARTASLARLDIAQAVPPALAGAIQTYREAQARLEASESSDGDTAAARQALDAAQGELAALCAALGQPDIDACIALADSGGFGAPAAAQPAPEAEPTPQTQPAPEAEPAPEPGAQPETGTQPAPEPALDPVPEPQPDQEPEPVPEPADAPLPRPEPGQIEPVQEPAPEPQPQTQPAPAPEPAPAPQPDAQPEPAAGPTPPPRPEPAQPEASGSEPAPAPLEQDAPAGPSGPAPETAAPPASSAPAPLVAAAEAYRQALADHDAALASGGDTAATAEALASAEADLREICSVVGLVDLDTCLATFGIELDIVTPQPLETPAVETPSVEIPATDEGAETLPAPEEQELRDDIVLEGDVQGELVPDGVDASEVAPLLDSDKDAFAAEARGDVEALAPTEAPAEAAPQAEPAAVPPASDVEAQPAIEAEEIAPITAEQGARRETAPLTATQEGAELVGPVETPTNMELITTIGLATVFAIGANYFINALDTPRIVEDNYRDYWIEDLPGGRTREIIVRPDGTQLVTIRDRYGDIVRRSRIERDGREILLVYVDENYRRYDEQGRWIDPGRELPPLRLNIPVREYVLDASYADERRVANFLSQPPVETIERYYTIEEVKRSSRLRDMVRRLEIGDLTFETASANIGPDQVATLSAVANAMLDLIRANPAETFLIEGHTDAVGSDLYNLELSNRRAESIAYALTRAYGIPPENLATQGYGERYLKINTQAAERLNRRVTIRRITPLITPVAPAG